MEGDLTSSTDVENGQSTHYKYNDSLDRLTETDYPDGGITTNTYNDGTYSAGGSIPNVTTAELLNASQNLWKATEVVSDGLGQAVQTVLVDPDSTQGNDTVETVYDGEGRAYTKTNPHRSVALVTDGTSHFYYDALGRPVVQQHADSTCQQWCYDGVASTLPTGVTSNCSAHLGVGPQGTGFGTWVDSSDENGNKWQRTSDAFGNLTWVMEPNGSSKTASMETDYGLHVQPMTLFHFNDWLGTRRVTTNADGSQYNCWTGLAFGNNYVPCNTGVADTPDLHYTGKEHDVESGNDYFGARFMANRMGRFMSPDWSAKVEPVPYSRLGDPQSLNLYGFVGNNPLTRVDADGHQCGTNGQTDCQTGQQQPQVPGGSGNAQNSKFLQTVKEQGEGLVHTEPGKVVLLGGTTEVSTTTNAGFAQINSTGSTNFQAIPGVGQTVDVTVHAPGVTPDSTGFSLGTPVVSGSVTTNSATVSVGLVAGPPVKGGPNVSADAHAVVDALHTAVSAAKGYTVAPPPSPNAPGPPSCSVAGAC
jgi:RHS repeat-associated protein